MFHPLSFLLRYPGAGPGIGIFRCCLHFSKCMKLDASYICRTILRRGAPRLEMSNYAVPIAMAQRACPRTPGLEM